MAMKRTKNVNRVLDAVSSWDEDTDDLSPTEMLATAAVLIAWAAEARTEDRLVKEYVMQGKFAEDLDIQELAEAESKLALSQVGSNVPVGAITGSVASGFEAVLRNQVSLWHALHEGDKSRVSIITEVLEYHIRDESQSAYAQKNWRKVVKAATTALKRRRVPQGY